MKQHLAKMGYLVTDLVTGFEGVVTSVGFDLYGCVQAVVTPVYKPDASKESMDSRWFDEKRLRVIGDKPVMEVPTFEIVPGGQSLPVFPSHPLR